MHKKNFKAALKQQSYKETQDVDVKASRHAEMVSIKIKI